MFVTFFDMYGMFHKKFVPSGQTVSEEYYWNYVSFGSNNSWSKTSVSGKRKPVPLA
jgi:hypothetical protein